MDFADSQLLNAAAPEGTEAFKDFLRGTGWINRPERVDIGDVTGIKWDKPSGWMRLAAGETIIGGQIPNRDHGDKLLDQIKTAIATQRKRQLRRKRRFFLRSSGLPPSSIIACQSPGSTSGAGVNSSSKVGESSAYGFVAGGGGGT